MLSDMEIKTTTERSGYYLDEQHGYCSVRLALLKTETTCEIHCVQTGEKVSEIVCEGTPLERYEYYSNFYFKDLPLAKGKR